MVDVISWRFLAFWHELDGWGFDLCNWRDQGLASPNMIQVWYLLRHLARFEGLGLEALGFTLEFLGSVKKKREQLFAGAGKVVLIGRRLT